MSHRPCCTTPENHKWRDPRRCMECHMDWPCAGEVLRPSLTDRGIEQWFNAANRYLGGERPVDVLARNEQSRVAKAAASFLNGDYL